MKTDPIWYAASLFSTPESPQPSWSGYMHRISHGDHLPSAAITLLPIINLKTIIKLLNWLFSFSGTQHGVRGPCMTTRFFENNVFPQKY